MGLLNFLQVFEYIGEGKRPYREGQAILDAGHIIDVKKENMQNNELNLKALCLQTSSIRGDPHIIKISTPTFEGTCSCKAGSNKCKHVAAVLLKLIEVCVDDLHEISCTDEERKWGKLKTAAQNKLYDVTAIAEYCHVKTKKKTFTWPESIPDHINAAARESLLQGFSNAVIKPLMEDTECGHLRKKPKLVHETYTQEILPFETEIFTKGNPTLLDDISSLMLLSANNQSAINFYHTYVEISPEKAIQIYNCTRGQNSLQWKQERQIRITGSIAHSLFTYSRNASADWEKKLTSVTFPTFSGNVHTQYGLKAESIAKSAFTKNCDNILHFVDNPGLVIHHQNPWFGFSPDALLIFSTGHKEVIEIKSPKLGKELLIDELPDKLKFLTLKDTGGVALKTKHQYYSQLQLGLLLCNVPEGRLLVYSEKSKNNLEIRVNIDHIYCKELIKVLTNVYFQRNLNFYDKNSHKLYISKNILQEQNK